MDKELDEIFNLDLRLAKCLIDQLIHNEDKEICCRWIKKLCSLKSPELLVKIHRNHFFRYLLNVIKNSTSEVAEKSLPAYSDKRREMLRKSAEFSSHWSADGRTYIAAKALPGRGALLYIAVTKYPELGWDLPPEEAVY